MPGARRSFRPRAATGPSLSHDLNNDAFGALAVELGVINLLPGPEIELAGGHRHDHLVMDEEALEVRIAIGLAGAMVPVVVAEGRQLFEPLVDVGDEPVLGIVDPDPGGDVHGRDEDHALADAALAERGGDLWSDVDVLAVVLGGEGKVLSVESHTSR